jgi:hypothetical protein
MDASLQVGLVSIGRLKRRDESKHKTETKLKTETKPKTETKTK